MFMFSPITHRCGKAPHDSGFEAWGTTALGIIRFLEYPGAHVIRSHQICVVLVPTPALDVLRAIELPDGIPGPPVRCSIGKNTAVLHVQKLTGVRPWQSSARSGKVGDVEGVDHRMPELCLAGTQDLVVNP